MSTIDFDESKKESTSNPLKTSGKNISYWLDSTEPIIYPKLNEDLSADVVVVGGGISGLTAAYLLSLENKKVILVEDGLIGSGETGRTTAHLVNALDDRYYEIQSLFGEEKARLAAESHTAAIDMIEKIVNDEKIDCDFERVDGYLFLHPSDKQEHFEDEYKAARHAGIKVELVDDAPGIKNIKSRFIKFPSQAQFHPMKYLKGLCDAITNNGGKIFTLTHAEEVSKEGIKTSGGNSIKASAVIVATNTPVINMFVMHTKQAPYRTYVIAAKIKKGALPYSLWWDTGDFNSTWSTYPYHYVRLQKYNDEFDLLISGGEDHKTGQPEEDKVTEEERFINLFNWTKQHFPEIEELEYKWSGQVMEPVDSLGFIGHNPTDPDNIYIVTGDSGNGITNGTLAGIILTDLIAGRKNKFSDLYDPARKTLKTTDVFLEEQANVIKQYGEFFKASSVKEVSEVRPGEGAIMNNGLKKVALFRDTDNKVFAFSAICPHMKCVLQWNSTEKTFDCPCHGSRFSSFGKVINGPANGDLEEVDIPD
jgi:glycine/D-amino acid oxidase-like deaminating enzyme/nitrite reductase/ring-hydroxylating ferredoxin subunit